jgi:hypothetical protein
MMEAVSTSDMSVNFHETTCATSQKTVFFIFAAVRNWNLTGSEEVAAAGWQILRRPKSTTRQATTQSEWSLYTAHNFWRIFWDTAAEFAASSPVLTSYNFLIWRTAKEKICRLFCHRWLLEEIYSEYTCSVVGLSVQYWNLSWALSFKLFE